VCPKRAPTRWTTIDIDTPGTPGVRFGREGWHDTQDDDYLTSVVSRAADERLEWCAQLFDLLESPELGLSPYRYSLNDFGCQYFQVYKELLSRPHLSVDYFGYDIEQQYIDIGLQLFPELQSSYKVADLARGGGIREADVSVISATLEHIDDFSAVVGVLAQKSRKVVVIRSFFGSSYLKDLGKKPSAVKPYPVQQFVLQDLLYPAFVDWEVEVVRDRHTDSMPIVKFFENGPIVRTAYFVVLRRNSPSSPATKPV
jgi:hypothetical protein